MHPDSAYDPSDFDDRLLIRLKGTMSEAELHFLKARMLEGEAPRRGAASSAWPTVCLTHYRLLDNWGYKTLAKQ
jgi:hypothetical protein